jgi:hypothetical protein
MPFLGAFRNPVFRESPARQLTKKSNLTHPVKMAPCLRRPGVLSPALVAAFGVRLVALGLASYHIVEHTPILLVLRVKHHCHLPVSWVAQIANPCPPLASSDPVVLVVAASVLALAPVYSYPQWLVVRSRPRHGRSPL